MGTLTLRLVLAATAATSFCAILPAQQAIAVPGTGTQVKAWVADGVEHNAVSRDGGATWVSLPTSSHQINWRGRMIDPKVGDSTLPASLAADASNELFYVQFETEVIPEYAAAMEQLGAEFTRYHPNRALITRIASSRTEALRGEPFVRAVMPMAPAHKLDGKLQVAYLNGELGTARYNIMLLDKHRDAAVLEGRIGELGGVLEAPADGGIVVSATLTPAQLLTVARENTVLWIDEWSAPEYDIDILRIEAGVDYVEAVAAVDGKGITGHVNEGIYDHTEWRAIPPYRTDKISLMGSSGSGHGTNTAGEIYARGAPGGVRGILPFGQMIYSPSIGSQRYQLVQTLVDPNDIYKAVMMTQSWGGTRTYNYTSTSAMLDDILFDFDHMFSTNSQSNAGTPDSRPEAWAKNVCGIGGFNHYGTSTPADDCWCFTGSTGPAQDGRVGVSFAAYYDGIHTTSGNPQGASNYTFSFGGTSGATPIVNGLAGGAIQMFTDGLFGYPGVNWSDRFDVTPNLTTTRVMLAMCTRQLDFTTGAIRVEQGWGLPNLGDLYDNRDNMLILDEEDVLTQGEARTYTVWVKPGTAELRASMHHLEDEAVPSAIPTRINSLDLQVVAPNGDTYWGNGNGILTSQWSAPGGVANDIDIHENVFIQNPAAGAYDVSVTATAVRGDSHKETAAMDADFALAIRGIGGGRDMSGMVVDLISDAPQQLDVAVSNLPAAGWTHGFTVFSRITPRHVSLGDYFGIESSQLSKRILNRTPVAGNIFAFTNAGGPTQYPNATYNFKKSIATSVAGSTLDVVVVLFDAGGNVVNVSNVDRVQVQ